MNLSKRLLAAAQQVRENSVAADVGCDHGKLCAWLIQSGRARFAYATDINPQPLAAASELFSSLNIADKTEAVLTDGVVGLPNEVTDVVIAGLGADVILGIIDRSSSLRDRGKQLVLVPATRHALLRRGLAARGFRTLHETAVFEGGHCYAVITASCDGTARGISEPEAQRGLISSTTPDGKRYIESATARLKKQLEGLKKSAKPDTQRIKTLGELIQKLQNEVEQW